jgi:hypothetical protein
MSLYIPLLKDKHESLASKRFSRSMENLGGALFPEN